MKWNARLSGRLYARRSCLAALDLELTPQFSYAHWDSVQDPFIRNSYSAGLSFRMGLPWTSQVTVSVPYVWNEGRTHFRPPLALAMLASSFPKNC